MELFYKVLMIIPSLLFPSTRSAQAIKKRIKETKKIMTNCPALRWFWRIIGILFNVIFLPIILLTALIKTLLLWILPSDLYSALRFSIKAFLEDIVDRKMGLALACRRQKLRNDLFLKGREKRCSFGEKNPSVIFYVIRPYYYVAPNELLTHPQHLLYYYYLVLQKMSYAVQNGWTPVVDWENYEGLLYFAEDKPVLGTMNAWEYFWKQPSPYKLDEVYSSKNVILSTRNSVDYGWIPPTVMTRPFSNYAKRLATQCIRYGRLTVFNDYTERYIRTWQEKLFPTEKRILGAVYRSTSYGKEETPNKSHPVQPSLASLKKKIEKIMAEYNMEYVYFVNEETENIQYMQECFGEQLIVLPRERYKGFHEFSPEDPNPLYVMGERYKTNLSYLTEIVLLSRCTGLVGAMSSGTRAAIIWNQNQYEVVDIVDLGLW